MATKNRDGDWLNNRGKYVPEEYVPEMDRLRDSMVERVHKTAKKLESALLEAKLEMIAETEAFLETKAKDGKVKEGWKGNVILDSFDGTKRVDRRIGDLIGFSEGLQMAKTVIDEWIAKRLNGVDPALAKVISQAFNTDKRGKINTAMILRLLNIDIDDALWKKGMKILRDSIQVTSTRQYLAVYEKVSTETGEEMRQICLNFSVISTTTIPEEK